MKLDDVLNIADDQNSFMESMAARHQARLQRAILQLERRILDQVTVLNTAEGGVLLGPKVNLAQSQKIHSQLVQIFDEEYGQGVRKTISEYDQALPSILQQYAEMGEAAKFTGIDKDMIKVLKSMDLAEYARYGQAAQDKIASAIYSSVAGQTPFSTLSAAISGILVGHKDARGLPMSRYADQMANDGIMNFQNAVNMKKAADLKFETFLYYGNIIKDSRDFCIARAGNVYTKEQIESWTGPWKGKSGPAMTHRGGYNCRHHWQPVRTGWVPEGGIEVQTAFDRAGAMPVSKLPPEITESPKFKAYQAYQKALILDKQKLTATALAKQLDMKTSTVQAWVSRWKKGMDVPLGWQSVIRDLEAKAGGFERVVHVPKTEALQNIISKTAATAAVVATGIKFGDFVKLHSPVSGEFEGKITDAFRMIPDSIHAKILEAGFHIDLADFVTTIRPDLKGVVPRGWTSGNTWEMSDGFEDVGKKSIVVTEKRISGKTKLPELSPRPTYALLHEYGHAVDDTFKLLSQSPEFKAEWRKDVQFIKLLAIKEPSILMRYDYFIKNVNAYGARQEAFAESFMHAVSGNLTFYDKDPLYALRFKNTIQYIKDFLNTVAKEGVA